MRQPENRSEGACSVEYLPLIPRDASARLTLTSAELGLYQYDLHLVSTPALPERALQFKVGLGVSQTQTFRFMSYPKQKTEYSCRLDSPDFTAEKSVVAPAGMLFCFSF